MAAKVLIAYATKYGATAEIAEHIGQVITEVGLAAEVRPVEEVSDVGSYEAVVLGSAVYVGQWRKEAARFLETNEEALAQRPVWLFSSGPTGQGDPVALLKGWRLPQAQQPIADRVKPRDIAVFHGALDEKKLSLVEKMMIKTVKAPAGDYRDWAAITAWANGIAAALSSPMA